VLQLNRPKARNAISTHLLDTLSKHCGRPKVSEGCGEADKAL
jgi:enoyl-CoA hydratase/carnithine racemase